MSIMQINGELKSGLDFLADLWSGRVHRTLSKQQQDIKALATAFVSLRQENKNMTDNEKKILDAAQQITEAAESFQTQVDSLRTRVDTLTAQAESNQAFATEDLTEEFAALEASLGTLRRVSRNLVQPEPEVDVTVEDTPGVPVNPSDPAQPGLTVPAQEPTVPEPVTQQPNDPPAPGTEMVQPTEPVPTVADDPERPGASLIQPTAPSNDEPEAEDEGDFDDDDGDPEEFDGPHGEDEDDDEKDAEQSVPTGTETSANPAGGPVSDVNSFAESQAPVASDPFTESRVIPELSFPTTPETSEEAPVSGGVENNPQM